MPLCDYKKLCFRLCISFRSSHVYHFWTQVEGAMDTQYIIFSWQKSNFFPKFGWQLVTSTHFLLARASHMAKSNINGMRMWNYTLLKEEPVKILIFQQPSSETTNFPIYIRIQGWEINICQTIIQSVIVILMVLFFFTHIKHVSDHSNIGNLCRSDTEV